MTEPNLEDVYELSPMQQGMLFHTLYDPEGDLYFEQCVVTLRGKLDEARFARAWARVAARHTVLRSSFHWEGLEKPVQVVHPEVDLPFESFDWSGLPPDIQQSRLEAFFQQDRKRSFDLASAPLLRVTLLWTGEDLHEFVLSFQHLILDRWSRFVVLKEVFAEYGASEEGAQPVSRMRKAFERDLPIRWVFESPTVAQLAARAEAAEREDLSRILDKVERMPEKDTDRQAIGNEPPLHA